MNRRLCIPWPGNVKFAVSDDPRHRVTVGGMVRWMDRLRGEAASGSGRGEFLIVESDTSACTFRPKVHAAVSLSVILQGAAAGGPRLGTADRRLIKILEDVPLPGETRSRARLRLATVGMFLEATPDAPTASAQP
jgi:hypothetical protein